MKYGLKCVRYAEMTNEQWEAIKRKTLAGIGHKIQEVLPAGISKFSVECRCEQDELVVTITEKGTE